MEIVNKALCILASLILISCSNNVVFDDSERVAVPEWNCDSIVSFDVNIEDCEKLYQTALLIRNSGKYEFQNIWLFVKEIAPDSTVSIDTLQYFLADDYGRWLGSGIGSLYTNLFMYNDSVKYTQKGIYRYEIEHGMRVEDLAGLNDIGLKVMKLE